MCRATRGGKRTPGREVEEIKKSQFAPIAEIVAADLGSAFDLATANAGSGDVGVLSNVSSTPPFSDSDCNGNAVPDACAANRPQNSSSPGSSDACLTQLASSSSSSGSFWWMWK